MSTTIYVTDTTKALLEKVVIADGRGQDGEILFLLKQRAKELGIDPVAGENSPSVKGHKSSTGGGISQEKSEERASRRGAESQAGKRGRVA